VDLLKKIYIREVLLQLLSGFRFSLLCVKGGRLPLHWSCWRFPTTNRKTNRTCTLVNDPTSAVLLRIYESLLWLFDKTEKMAETPLRAKEERRDYWIPIESNPTVMNKVRILVLLCTPLFLLFRRWDLVLIHKQQTNNQLARAVGVSEEWGFTDCLGLDPDLLAFIPQPCLAVLFLFPYDEVCFHSSAITPTPTTTTTTTTLGVSNAKNDSRREKG